MSTHPAAVRSAYESSELMPSGTQALLNRISTGWVSVPSSTYTRDCWVGSSFIAAIAAPNASNASTAHTDVAAEAEGPEAVGKKRERQRGERHSPGGPGVGARAEQIGCGIV